MLQQYEYYVKNRNNSLSSWLIFSYEYNNIYYTSKLTIGEMGTILNSYDLGTYRKGFNLVRSVANHIGIGRI